MTSRKSWMAVAAVACVSVGAYWYYSPYLTMKALHEAAQNKDAETFNQGVDYTKVRESLKGQMSAIVTEKVGDPSGNGVAALGAMLGLALANQVVEAYVRPEVVMRAMARGDLKPAVGNAPEADEKAGGSVTREKSKINWTFERKGVDKIVAYGHKSGQASDEPVAGFGFERSGFAQWKLTEIRLPEKQ